MVNPKAKSSPSLHAPRAPLSLAFFAFGLVGINGGANGVLLPSMSAFYHVGDATIGLLFLVSSAGYFLSALGSGLLTERLGLRWLLMLGTIAFLLGLLGFGIELPFILSTTYTPSMALAHYLAPCLLLQSSHCCGAGISSTF